MINNLLYVAGAPGVGKSTLLRELRSGWDTGVNKHHAVPHIELRHPGSGRLVGVELGVPRDDFPGTDALSMSIGPHALTFLSTAYLPFALGEGSRLATRPFIGGLAQRGVRTTLVLLKGSQELLDERWRARGSKQNPSWRRGAATRADGVALWFRGYLGTDGFHQLLELRADDRSPADLADEVRDAFPLLDLRESAA